MIAAFQSGLPSLLARSYAFCTIQSTTPPPVMRNRKSWRRRRGRDGAHGYDDIGCPLTSEDEGQLRQRVEPGRALTRPPPRPDTAHWASVSTPPPRAPAPNTQSSLGKRVKTTRAR